MNPLEYARRILAGRRHRITTAKSPQHNDVYVVEFPKSGVSWLSTLLANTALIESGRSEVASFTAAQLFVPDIHVTRDIAPMAYDRPPVRLIKSHAEFNPNYVFVIYLVRHPLAVMKSYFRFNNEGARAVTGAFDVFCRSESHGIPAWKRHVNSWLSGEVIAQRVHLCRYEDLLVDPAGEIEAISRNYGWELGRSSIDEAVRRSTMDRMKESESFYRERNPRYTMNFVGGGSAFDISDELVTYVEKSCREELHMLGYESTKQ